MQNRRWNSAASPERRRFMPASHILLFGLLLLGALLAVFPGQRLERRLDSSAFADTLSLAYLQAWLRGEPHNARLRLILARRQLLAGEADVAAATLAPLLQGGTADAYYTEAALLLQLDMLEQRLWQQAPGSAAFATARAALLQQLDAVAERPWSAEQLQKFARLAVALQAPEQALRYWRRLLAADPYEAMTAYEGMADLQLAAGHYREAAATHFQAMAVAPDRRLRRQHFLAGLRALQAGDLQAEALAAAQRYEALLADDDVTLEFLARLARAANRLDLAESYVARLLRQSLPLAAPGVGP